MHSVLLFSVQATSATLFGTLLPHLVDKDYVHQQTGCYILQGPSSENVRSVTGPTAWNSHIGLAIPSGSILYVMFYVKSVFVRDYPGRPVREETFTHSHLSCSSDILYQLSPPTTTIASSLFNLRAWQSFSTASLQTGPLWSSSWHGTLYFILHTFLCPIIIFLQHMHIPSQPILL